MDVEVRCRAGRQAAAVPVPSVVTSSADEPDTPLGPNWMIVERIDGETLARRILRDDEYRCARSVLAGHCGERSPRIHSIEITAVPALVEVDQLVHAP